MLTGAAAFDALDLVTVERVGDPLLYRDGACLTVTRGFIDYADADRDPAAVPWVQEVVVELSRADQPLRPARSDAIELPVWPGQVFHPRGVAIKGTFWRFGIERAFDPDMLDTELTIERPGEPYHNGYQWVDGEPVSIGPLAARVVPVVGTEGDVAGALVAVGKARAWLVWDADAASITPKDRIAWDGATWDVDSAITIGERAGVELLMSRAS